MRRPVTDRDSRIAWNVASLPLVQQIIWSADGMTEHTSSATSTSARLMPTPMRSTGDSASVTAASTSGSLCPRTIAPNAAW
jgi:hypothetical protein